MTHICKLYVFKIVISLALLNSLVLLKSRKKNVKLIIFFPISPKYIYIYISQFLPQNLRPFSSKGALSDCLSGLSLGPALLPKAFLHRPRNLGTHQGIHSTSSINNWCLHIRSLFICNPIHNLQGSIAIAIAKLSQPKLPNTLNFFTLFIFWLCIKWVRMSFVVSTCSINLAVIRMSGFDMIIK